MGRPIFCTGMKLRSSEHHGRICQFHKSGGFLASISRDGELKGIIHHLALTEELSPKRTPLRLLSSRTLPPEEVMLQVSVTLTHDIGERWWQSVDCHSFQRGAYDMLKVPAEHGECLDVGIREAEYAL